MPHLNLMVKRCEPIRVGLATPGRRSSSQAGLTRGSRPHELSSPRAVGPPRQALLSGLDESC
jgi:hypothetical protein